VEGDIEAVIRASEEAGVPAIEIGKTGGDSVVLGDASVPLGALRTAHEGWFPNLMNG